MSWHCILGLASGGIASNKRTGKLGHLVSCFGVRSQRANGSPARCGQGCLILFPWREHCLKSAVDLSGIGLHELRKSSTPGSEACLVLALCCPSHSQIAQTGHHLYPAWFTRGVPILVKAPVSAVVELVLDGPMAPDESAQPVLISLLGPKTGQVKGRIPGRTIF